MKKTNHSLAEIAALERLGDTEVLYQTHRGRVELLTDVFLAEDVAQGVQAEEVLKDEIESALSKSAQKDEATTAIGITTAIGELLKPIIADLKADGLDASVLDEVSDSMMFDINAVNVIIHGMKLWNFLKGKKCPYKENPLLKFTAVARDQITEKYGGLYGCNADKEKAAKETMHAYSLVGKFGMGSLGHRQKPVLRPTVDCMLQDLVGDGNYSTDIADAPLTAAIGEIVGKGTQFIETGKAKDLLYDTVKTFLDFYIKKEGNTKIIRLKKALMVYFCNVIIQKVGAGELERETANKMIHIIYFENILWAVGAEKKYGNSEASKLNVKMGMKLLVFSVSCIEFEKQAPVAISLPVAATQHMIHLYTLWIWKFVKWLYHPTLGSPMYSCAAVTPGRYALNALPNLAWPISGTAPTGELWFSRRASALMAQIRYTVDCDGKVRDLMQLV